MREEMTARRTLGAAALAVAVATPSPATAVPAGPLRSLPSDTVEAIEVALSTTMSRVGAPALSVAIGREGRLVYAAGYGLTDVENFVPAKSDSVYRIASISKVITAVALLQLVAQERVDLDAEVREHCPAFPEKPWPVSARQLLGHRGGVRHYHDGEQTRTQRFESVEGGLALFRDDPLEFEPGTRFLYSTYGYNLLGCVIEGVTGRPYATVVGESIFAPAGMTGTGPEDVRALVANRARGYVRDDQGRLLNAALADMSYKVPGGGITSTAPDLARFGLALLSGRLLDPESVEELLHPRDAVEGQTETWGLALPVGTRDGRREAWHLGGQEGSSTALYMRPDSGTVVSVLTNLEGIEVSLLDLARVLADVVERSSGT
jgi:CubicO group peptidase (beta-lactamase class C family)